MENKLLAHVRQDEKGKWHEHPLKKHLEGTAKLAEEFAAVFGLNTLAGLVGKVHDYGKASQKFQDKIDPELHVNLHWMTCSLPLPSLFLHDLSGCSPSSRVYS